MKLSNQTKERLLRDFGDWAIVTGATSGIGLELSRQLASAGFNLVLNSRSLSALAAVSQELKSHYKIETRLIEADLSESQSIQQIIDETKELNIGLLINNAGFGTSGSFLDTELRTEQNLIRVNCGAVLGLTHYFGRQFKEKQKGCIIFLSSLVAFQGVPYAANYAASKAYIQSFAEALQIELKPFGVSILSVAPGPVNSGFGDRANMKMNGALSPTQIGVPILNALGRKKSVIPGFLSKVLIYSLRTAPRSLKVRIMALVMGGFTKHQRI